MLRKRILQEIKEYCQAEYGQITDWVHDINHVQRVVKNGRKIANLENFKDKDKFLVEIACWLHDVGRVGEESGLQFLKSHHAERSYLKAKILLGKYQKNIGRESIYKVLQAIREHSLPSLGHPENPIAQLLLDADRGAGFSILGIFTMFNYLKVIQTEPVRTISQARKLLPTILINLKKEKKKAEALQKIGFLKDWYYGSQSQSQTGVKVNSLYTKSAKIIFKKGIQDIEKFETKIIKL